MTPESFDLFYCKLKHTLKDADLSPIYIHTSSLHVQTHTQGAPSHHAGLTPGPQPTEQPTLPHPLLFFRSPLLDLSISLFIYVLLWHATTTQMCACAHFIFTERKAAKTKGGG